jgi:hypothetical protein
LREVVEILPSAETARFAEIQGRGMLELPQSGGRMQEGMRGFAHI